MTMNTLTTTLLIQTAAFTMEIDTVTGNNGGKTNAITIFALRLLSLLLNIALTQLLDQPLNNQLLHIATAKMVRSIIMGKYGQRMNVIIISAKMAKSV